MNRPDYSLAIYAICTLLFLGGAVVLGVTR